MNKNFKEETIKKMQALKKIYATSDSIFIDNPEKIFKDESYMNRYDEWLLKQIGIGFLSLALESNDEIRELLTDEDIDDLFYSIYCTMDSTPIEEAIEESYKYDLSC